MGAQESKSPDPQHQNDDDVAIQDYYSILEITQTADQDEIKKAFRRQALIHHPDKNAGDVEAATKRFAAIQQAYEVLSDEQERAWYDSHRASLIPEADAATVLEEVRTGKKRPQTKDRGLTVRHLMKFFDASIWSGFDDSPKSFFALYRNLFLRLASEEAMWSDSQVQYSSFGHPDWPWNAPRGQEAARNFYNQWLSFSTAKDFTWAEHYSLSEAPDRRIRRLVEKENKKARDDAKREYNETIRSLVLFIRKRDPRYKQHISQNAQSTPSPGFATKEASIEAARRREQAGQAYVEQSWQRIKIEDIDNGAEWEEAEGEEEWECVACSRTFRSEAAWESHERSRKHLKEVDRLRREMQDEDEQLNMDDEPSNVYSDENIVPDQDGPRVAALDDATQEGGDIQYEPPDSSVSSDTPPLRPKGKKKRKGAKSTAVFDTTAQEVSPVRESSLERGLPATPDVPANQSTNALSEPMSIAPNHDQQHQQQQLSKKDKRRAREAKKAQAVAAHVCNVCHSPFDSKTKLFNHIRDTGHALANREDSGGDDPSSSKGQKGRKTRR